MKALAQYCKDHAISQAELARKIGTDRHQVNKWIKGAKEPTLATRRKIAKRLGLTTPEMLS